MHLQIVARAKGNFVSGLILVPTRELAKQVADSVKSYAVHFNGAGQNGLCIWWCVCEHCDAGNSGEAALY